MSRLKGRGTLTLFLMICFTLLVIIYHILGNEVDDVTTGKVNIHPENEAAYPLGELNDDVKIMQRGQLESNILTDEKNKIYISDDEADQRYETHKNNAPLFKGHKIVHLDLKGAPPKVNYYNYLFPLLKKLGATGVLIEYEDMFPFNRELQNITALNHYTHQEISDIQDIAADNNLIVIPLIQTFGHFEFVLKLEKYKDLREVARYPQALCPSHSRTLPLLYEMLDQVIRAHPKINHIHIGADEVYQLGECNRCQDVMLKNQWDKQQLFLAHVTRVAKYIKSKYPSLTILMWDDEFRDILPEEIIKSRLNSLIEPVVWKYTSDPGSSLTEIWDNYALVWPKSIWFATAFKGATDPDRYYTDISYHVKNHEGWLEIIDKYADKITFKGAILTGWQRYDHFSVLCELFPSSIPSLAVNLAVLQLPELSLFPMLVPKHITDLLKCDARVSLSVPEPQYGWAMCNYHGSMIYGAALRLFSLNQEITKMEQENTFKGWFKEYNIKYAFSSPSHVEQALGELERHRMEIIYIEEEMRRAMEGIYDNYTVQEWLETYTEPLNEKIGRLRDAKAKILDHESWPRRPLTKPEL